MTTKRVGVVSQRIKSDLSVSNGEGIVLQHLEAASSQPRWLATDCQG